MNSILLSRIALISLFTLVLSACGGGGGGGGGGSDNSSSTPAPTGCLGNTFNRFLPLTEETSINYDFNATSGAVSCDVALSDENGTDIYSIDYEFGMQPLTLYVNSTSDGITLYGIDGPIEMDLPVVGTRELDQVRFDEPVILLDDGPAINGRSVSATGKSGGTDVTLNFEYDKTETNGVYEDNLVFGAGDLPSRVSSLELRIVSVKIGLLTLTPTATLNTELTMAEGIGLLRHEHTAVGLTFGIASNISSVSGLPYPLWLDFVADNAPTVNPDSTSYFSIDGTSVNSSDYSLVNAADISATSWLNIEADNAGEFQVVTTYDAALDTLPLPYSVQVIFEHISSGKRVSTSVTLID